LPHNYADPNCVVYTGTHDNDTTRGWFETVSEAEQAFVRRYLGAGGGQIAEELMRLALSSTANTAIVPLQDVLNLGSEARMNTPGAPEGNWTWRVLHDQLDPARADCLAEMTTVYGRSQRDQ
jgi:4-alpha-glucanotransferase